MNREGLLPKRQKPPVSAERDQRTVLVFPFSLTSRVDLRDEYPVAQNKTGLTLLIDDCGRDWNSANPFGPCDDEVFCSDSRRAIRQRDCQHYHPSSIGIHGVCSCGSQRHELSGSCSCWPVQQQCSSTVATSVELFRSHAKRQVSSLSIVIYYRVITLKAA